jgi:hypothetical protein
MVFHVLKDMLEHCTIRARADACTVVRTVATGIAPGTWYLDSQSFDVSLFLQVFLAEEGAFDHLRKVIASCPALESLAGFGRDIVVEYAR